MLTGLIKVRTSSRLLQPGDIAPVMLKLAVAARRIVAIGPSAAPDAAMVD